MKMSDWEAGFIEDLAHVAAIADADTQRAIEALVRVWQPMLRNRVLELMTVVSAELSESDATGADIELRIAGDDVSFAAARAGDEGASIPAPPKGEHHTADADARISLRISESLKERLATAAATDGMSVNTWIARALERAVARPHIANPPTGTTRMQLRGFGRS